VSWLRVLGRGVKRLRMRLTYQKAGTNAIAAQQLFGGGVKLRRGQTVEYIITNSECSVPKMVEFVLSPFGKDGSVTKRQLLALGAESTRFRVTLGASCGFLTSGVEIERTLAGLTFN
jgi:hypothetical protein